MRHTCLHSRRWCFQNILAQQSVWTMLAEEGPPRRQASPRRAWESSNSINGLLLSIMSSLSIVKTFIMTWQGLLCRCRSDAFRDAPPTASLFLSVILVKWLRDKGTTPGARLPMSSWILNHEGPANDWQIFFKTYKKYWRYRLFFF